MSNPPPPQGGASQARGQEQQGDRQVPARVWWAAVLLAALIIVVSISAFTPALRVCDNSDDSKTCRPVAYSDPAVLLTLGLALVIAFPDWTRLKVDSSGVEAERDPKMLPNSAHLSERKSNIELGKIQEWEQGSKSAAADPSGGGDAGGQAS